MFILGIKLWLINVGFYNDFNNLIIEVNEYFVVDFVDVFYVNLWYSYIVYSYENLSYNDFIELDKLFIV